MTNPPDPSRMPFDTPQGPEGYGPASGAYTPQSYAAPNLGMSAQQPFGPQHPGPFGAPQGYPMPAAPTSMPPSNSMGWAVTAICIGLLVSPLTFGWVLGIIGAIRATDVRKRWELGDFAGAEQAARNAKTFSIIGIGITVVASVLFVVLYIALMVFAGAMA